MYELLMSLRIGVKEPPNKDKEKEKSKECKEIENDDENEDSEIPESHQISQTTDRGFAMTAEKKLFPC